MSVLRTRIRQIVLKKEDVENVAETLVAGDVLALGIFNASASFDVPLFDRTPSSPTLSRLPGVPGLQTGVVTLETDIKGSGSVNVRPPVGALLEGAGFAEEYRYTLTLSSVVGAFVVGDIITGSSSGAIGEIRKAISAGGVAIITTREGDFTTADTITGSISGATADVDSADGRAGFIYKPQSKTTLVHTIGAITAGPLFPGEHLTQATSGAVGICLAEYANGVTKIYFQLVSGTFDAVNTVTGGKSGASYTPSTVTSCAQPTQSLTIESREDGIIKKFKGARSKFTMNFSTVGEPARVEWEIQGSPTSNPIDGPLFPNVADNVVPERFLGATLLLDSYVPIINSLSVVVDNTLTPRTDATDTSGILSVLISDRNFTGSMDPEMVNIATDDFYGDWLASNTKSLQVKLGSSAGNQVEVFAPSFQYTNISDDDRDGIAVAGLEFQMNGGPGGGDDDILFYFY